MEKIYVLKDYYEIFTKINQSEIIECFFIPETRVLLKNYHLDSFLENLPNNKDNKISVSEIIKCFFIPEDRDSLKNHHLDPFLEKLPNNKDGFINLAGRTFYSNNITSLIFESNGRNVKWVHVLNKAEIDILLLYNFMEPEFSCIILQEGKEFNEYLFGIETVYEVEDGNCLYIIERKEKMFMSLVYPKLIETLRRHNINPVIEERN